MGRLPFASILAVLHQAAQNDCNQFCLPLHIEDRRSNELAHWDFIGVQLCAVLILNPIKNVNYKSKLK